MHSRLVQSPYNNIHIGISTYIADNADQLTNLVTTTSGVTTQNLTRTCNRDGARIAQADSISGTTMGYAGNRLQMGKLASGAAPA